MSSPALSAPAQPNATTTLTRDELAPALQIDVFDRDGKATTLGQLIHGKRTVLIFIRHFCKISKFAAVGVLDVVLTTTSQGV
jgi:hypothetical protein